MFWWLMDCKRREEVADYLYKPGIYCIGWVNPQGTSVKIASKGRQASPGEEKVVWKCQAET
jgi:hypothetical protein